MMVPLRRSRAQTEQSDEADNRRKKKAVQEASLARCNIGLGSLMKATAGCICNFLMHQNTVVP